MLHDSIGLKDLVSAGPTAASGRDIDLLCVGDIGVDLMVQVPHLPEMGGKVVGGFMGVFDGGMSANVAVAARRASDLRIELVSRLGDDGYGLHCLEVLGDEGVGTGQRGLGIGGRGGVLRTAGTSPRLPGSQCG